MGQDKAEEVSCKGTRERADEQLEEEGWKGRAQGGKRQVGTKSGKRGHEAGRFEVASGKVEGHILRIAVGTTVGCPDGITVGAFFGILSDVPGSIRYRVVEGEMRRKGTSKVSDE